jgi:hypothetical protein
VGVFRNVPRKRIIDRKFFALRKQENARGGELVGQRSDAIARRLDRRERAFAIGIAVAVRVQRQAGTSDAERYPGRRPQAYLLAEQRVDFGGRLGRPPGFGYGRRRGIGTPCSRRSGR